MKIVIDIPEGVYNQIVEEDLNGIMANAIKNGTLLPKRHGRLIDADTLRSMYSINRAYFNTIVGIQKWIDNAPTVIEADKEAENE